MDTKTKEEMKQFESDFNNAARLYKNTDDVARYMYINHVTPLKKRIEELLTEISNLNTVMIAAAEEIQAHWKAHCDEEGYGPANLMHRLEKGIPARYGYTAGAFESMGKEIERLKESNKHLEEWKRQQIEVTTPIFDWGQNQKDILVGTSIVKEVLKRLDEHKTLKESNKELVEAFARVLDRIEEQELQVNFPSAYKRAKDIIQKHEIK